jgi:hypothetical protein
MKKKLHISKREQECIRQEKRLKKYYKNNPEESPGVKLESRSRKVKYQIKDISEDKLNAIKERLRLDQEKHNNKPDSKKKYYGP